MAETKNNECVVTFNNGIRKVSMYFSTDDTGGLNMQMDVTPEVNLDEEPDLPLMLAGTFLTALQTDKKEDDKSEIYTGQD